MFEYDSANKEIVHKTFITRDYILNVYDAFVKDEDKRELAEEDIDSLVAWVVDDLNRYENDDDFNTDDCIDQTVREWIEADDEEK